MAINTFTAAKTLGSLRGWSLSNLEMQKNLYIAHMFFLGRHQEPLISEAFQAWKYGPVLPSLYHKLSNFGSDNVRDIFFSTDILTTGAEAETLREVSVKLANVPSGELIALTHREGGAWSTHYIPGAKGIVIPNGDILSEYNHMQ